MELVKDILCVIAFALITGCLVTIVKKILDFVNVKIDELQVKRNLSKYGQLNAYIDKAQEIVTTAVTVVAQTYTDALKKEGKFTPDAQSIAKEKATEIATELTQVNISDAVETVYGDFKVWLDNKIEQVVKETKKIRSME